MIYMLPLTVTVNALKPNAATGLPWWAWVLIVLALVVVLVWLMRRQPAESAQPEAAAPAPVEAAGVLPAPCAPRAATAPTQATPDDLTIIEGIGPKIAGLLQAAGITTFAQLGVADVDRLKGILAEAHLSRLADPTTWGDQATLAAAGKWGDLEKLTQQLKGGRRA
jgi:predicted flap endonuclease-1-like 5' DNA nuclease